MPRQARLDAPGVLHHVMVWGLERRGLFREDADREDVVGRLAALAEAGALTVVAWALLPNHAHLVVRYLHLNPLRAQVLADLRTLARYPWTVLRDVGAETTCR